MDEIKTIEGREFRFEASQVSSKKKKIGHRRKRCSYFKAIQVILSKINIQIQALTLIGYSLNLTS